MSAWSHWFWTLIVVGCLLWYSTVTLLVVVRGIVDIRGMLGRLKQDLADEEKDNPGMS